jgi:hypothetical protein
VVILPTRAASLSERHPCSSQDFAHRLAGGVPWVVMARVGKGTWSPPGDEFESWSIAPSNII